MITLIIVIYDLLRFIAVYHDSSYYFYFSQKEKQMPAHLYVRALRHIITELFEKSKYL